MGKQFAATTTRARWGGSASCESQIAASVRYPTAPLSVPALEAWLGGDPGGPSGRVEPFQPRQPVDAREPVAQLAAPLRVEKVVGEHRRVPLGEAERANALPCRFCLVHNRTLHAYYLCLTKGCSMPGTLFEMTRLDDSIGR